MKTKTKPEATRTEITKREGNGSRRVQLFLDPVSATEQHHVGDTNINAIMAKYNKTGQLPDPVLHAVYGDFSNAEDFHTAHDKILGAMEMFQSLDAEIRTFFENDPANLIEFVGNPDHLEEAQKMGLVPKEPIKPQTELEKAEAFYSLAKAASDAAAAKVPDESAETPPAG